MLLMQLSFCIASASDFLKAEWGLLNYNNLGQFGLCFGHPTSDHCQEKLFSTFGDGELQSILGPERTGI